VQCYQVTRLDSLLLRVLKSEVLGERVEPPEEEVQREVGRQQGGVCIVDITSTTRMAPSEASSNPGVGLAVGVLLLSLSAGLLSQ